MGLEVNVWGLDRAPHMRRSQGLGGQETHPVLGGWMPDVVEGLEGYMEDFGLDSVSIGGSLEWNPRVQDSLKIWSCPGMSGQLME